MLKLQSIQKKFFLSVIWDFSLGTEIEKTEAEVLFKVRPNTETSEWSEAQSFQSRYLRKNRKLHKDNFLNTEIGEAVKESAFLHRWLLFDRATELYDEF